MIVVANGDKIELPLSSLIYCPKCAATLADVKKIIKFRGNSRKDVNEDYIECPTVGCLKIYVPGSK